MEPYSYDYIHGTDVYLYQRKDMFRVNTDTSLLAGFMRIKEQERVLDIGTNNGALLCVANQAKPEWLYGIDIQEAAIEVAQKNMDHHGIHNVTLLCGDVCETALPKVDVIVCNPPYFKVNADRNLNDSASLQMARHERFLTLEKLCAKVSSLLDEKGRFYLVHRANRITEILLALKEHRLEARTLQFVYDENKEEAISVLVEAIKDGKANTHVLAPYRIKR